MGPVVDPVEADAVQPKRADMVVIGGGIVGVSTAYALAQKGISVVLCEKGQIAGEQSSRNWGWVRKTGRDEREIPLIAESLRMWEGMNEAVGAETGFRACGILYTSQTEADDAYHEDWLAARSALSTWRATTERGRGGSAATGFDQALSRRNVQPDRRPGGAAEGDARYRCSRAPSRCGCPDRMRRARCRADRRPRIRRGDGARPDRLRCRRSRRWRLVAVVLR